MDEEGTDTPRLSECVCTCSAVCVLWNLPLRMMTSRITMKVMTVIIIIIIISCSSINSSSSIFAESSSGTINTIMLMMITTMMMMMVMMIVVFVHSIKSMLRLFIYLL